MVKRRREEPQHLTDPVRPHLLHLLLERTEHLARVVVIDTGAPIRRPLVVHPPYVVHVHRAPVRIRLPVGVVLVLATIGRIPRLAAHVAPAADTPRTGHVGAVVVLLPRVTALRTRVLRVFVDQVDELVAQSPVEPARSQVALHLAVRGDLGRANHARRLFAVAATVDHLTV